MLLDVPDYAWHAGCFGTASGNLIAYWDRHGFPDMYTGPTGGGVAPLDNGGENFTIRALWASKAGLDGRPADQPGHIDDYWEFFFDDHSYSFEGTAPDPYATASRPEHAPDCLGDFIGQSQSKWADLNGECSGNIDGYAFTFWEPNGLRRENFTPLGGEGQPVPDIPSGLRSWSRYRGYEANVFSQLAEINPNAPEGGGFTFADLKAEIDAGYPLVLLLQSPRQFSRDLPGNPRANPPVHMMLAYGYAVTDGGTLAVRYRTSWASGDNSWSIWGPEVWEAGLPLRGVISFRPTPRIRAIQRIGSELQVRWDGPSSLLMDNVAEQITPAHWYVLEETQELGGEFQPVMSPLTELQATIPAPESHQAFYRVRLLTPEEAGQSRN